LGSDLIPSGLHPMELQVQPEKKEHARIPSGFSRWSFKFNLKEGACADTIGLQPMELQVQPKWKEHAQIPSCFSRWSFSFNLTARPSAAVTFLFCGLKLKLHRLKHDGILEAVGVC
jgi:hypothetical protein